MSQSSQVKVSVTRGGVDGAMRCSEQRLRSHREHPGLLRPRCDCPLPLVAVPVRALKPVERGGWARWLGAAVSSLPRGAQGCDLSLSHVSPPDVRSGFSSVCRIRQNMNRRSMFLFWPVSPKCRMFRNALSSANGAEWELQLPGVTQGPDCLSWRDPVLSGRPFSWMCWRRGRPARGETEPQVTQVG